MEKYTSGIFAGIFSKRTNVDLKEWLQVFSVRDLDDILRPTTMYVILNHIWNKVRSSNKKRVLVIDEAWNIMQHDDSAKFLFWLVKRARKYNLGITTITQDVEDFAASKYGKPIITNSSIQVLLKQSSASIDEKEMTVSTYKWAFLNCKNVLESTYRSVLLKQGQHNEETMDAQFKDWVFDYFAKLSAQKALELAATTLATEMGADATVLDYDWMHVVVLEWGNDHCVAIDWLVAFQDWATVVVRIDVSE